MRCKAVVYKGPEKVAVEDVQFPTLKLDTPDQQRDCPHGAILKVLASCICGSDLHMTRGKTTAQSGLQLGHEITGEVIEVGPHVEFIKVGDIVSVPFNVACGKCRNCKSSFTNICLNSNPVQPGGLLGYVDGGGWRGGQAEYAMVPWADFNLLKLCDDRDPNKDKVMDHMLDIAMLADILPTGYHGAVTAGVKPGSTVYIAGAGPVGMACAASCKHLLGASVVIVGDINRDRIMHAKSMGLDVVDLSSTVPLLDQIEKATGIREVDYAIDCVGFEAKGHGSGMDYDVPRQAMEDTLEAIKYGGGIASPGVYLPQTKKLDDEKIKSGQVTLTYGQAWVKGFTLATGQCPVMKYNYDLLRAILNDRIPIAKYVNATVVPLAEAESAYERFSAGESKKFVLDPHGMLQNLSQRATISGSTH